jgi:hypothetical protein
MECVVALAGSVECHPQERRIDMKNGIDNDEQSQSESISQRYKPWGSEDSIWKDFTHLVPYNLLVPRNKKDELEQRLRVIEREQILSLIKSPSLQKDLRIYFNSNEFDALKKKWSDLNDSDDEVVQQHALLDAQDLVVPQNTQRFIEKVNSCMSDLAGHSEERTDMIRLFTAKAAVRFAEEIGEDRERISRAWRIFVSMAKNNGYRFTLKYSVELEEKLEVLKRNFPNFSHVVDHFIRQIRVWALKQEGEHRIKPILLDGPKGTGKSAFARSLADVLDTYYEYVNLSSTSMGGVLTGTTSKWGNGSPGRIFSVLARSDTASPVILLDEIEKASTDTQFPVEGPLLAILEPQTSREFRDEYGNLEFDASRIIYIATSNDKSRLSDPVKSRFDAFSIGYPNSMQRKVIIGNMLKSTYQNTQFSAQALALLADQTGDLRELKSLLDDVVGLHVDMLLAQRAPRGASEPDQSNTGYEVRKINSSSQHQTQIIEESTVRACLQKLEHTDRKHFGFIEV